ncbi:MAG: hypothetical protein M3Y85_06700 [Bacteroidota bacterium]|nr:hypothetical protein [Bacteroidota bacterium]
MRARFFLPLLAAVFFFSCKKETEVFQTEALSTYLPTQPGKYITYRLDSTLFTNFGASVVVHSYQEKHEVDALITDNLGRPAYRVFRSIRDTTGTKPWQPVGSYFITPLTNTVEVVENNLRFLKLASPIKEGNTWKGNRYLPADAYNTYDFSNDDNIGDWDYTYTKVGSSLTLSGQVYANTITVDQINESTNAPLANSNAYGYLNYSVDKYAKGLGLIYQELTMWEYQPISSGRPGFKGFGVKRSIIAHN